MQNKLVPFFLIECCWQIRRNVICNRRNSACFSLPTVHVFKINRINGAEMFDVALIKSERYKEIQRATTKAALCTRLCSNTMSKTIQQDHLLTTHDVFWNRCEPNIAQVWLGAETAALSALCPSSAQAGIQSVHSVSSTKKNWIFSMWKERRVWVIIEWEFVSWSMLSITCPPAINETEKEMNGVRWSVNVCVHLRVCVFVCTRVI